jgi:hypothetical protein
MANNNFTNIDVNEYLRYMNTWEKNDKAYDLTKVFIACDITMICTFFLLYVDEYSNYCEITFTSRLKK